MMDDPGETWKQFLAMENADTEGGGDGFDDAAGSSRTGVTGEPELSGPRIPMAGDDLDELWDEFLAMEAAGEQAREDADNTAPEFHREPQPAAGQRRAKVMEDGTELLERYGREKCMPARARASAAGIVVHRARKGLTVLDVSGDVREAMGQQEPSDYTPREPQRSTEALKEVDADRKVFVGPTPSEEETRRSIREADERLPPAAKAAMNASLTCILEEGRQQYYRGIVEELDVVGMVDQIVDKKDAIVVVGVVQRRGSAAGQALPSLGRASLDDASIGRAFLDDACMCAEDGDYNSHAVLGMNDYRPTVPELQADDSVLHLLVFNACTLFRELATLQSPLIGSLTSRVAWGVCVTRTLSGLNGVRALLAYSTPGGLSTGDGHHKWIVTADLKFKFCSEPLLLALLIGYCMVGWVSFNSAVGHGMVLKVGPLVQLSTASAAVKLRYFQECIVDKLRGVFDARGQPEDAGYWAHVNKIVASRGLLLAGARQARDKIVTVLARDTSASADSTEVRDAVDDMAHCVKGAEEMRGNLLEWAKVEGVFESTCKTKAKGTAVPFKTGG